MFWNRVLGLVTESPQPAAGRAKRSILIIWQFSHWPSPISERSQRLVGRCSSPSCGGAGLGRDRYPGGPWGAVEGAWPSAGRMPAPLGRWMAALGALCYAPLGSRGPLAGARVAPLGWHVGLD